SGRDFANWNARKRNRIARVEVALSVCMIDDPRGHERKCGAYSESPCLSGARTKHHFRSVPWRYIGAAVSKLDPQRGLATVIIALFARGGPDGFTVYLNESVTCTNGRDVSSDSTALWPRCNSLEAFSLVVLTTSGSARTVRRSETAHV